MNSMCVCIGMLLGMRIIISRLYIELEIEYLLLVLKLRRRRKKKQPENNAIVIHFRMLNVKLIRYSIISSLHTHTPSSISIKIMIILILISTS